MLSGSLPLQMIKDELPALTSKKTHTHQDKAPIGYNYRVYSLTLKSTEYVLEHLDQSISLYNYTC